MTENPSILLEILKEELSVPKETFKLTLAELDHKWAVYDEYDCIPLRWSLNLGNGHSVAAIMLEFDSAERDLYVIGIVPDSAFVLWFSSADVCKSLAELSLEFYCFEILYVSVEKTIRKLYHVPQSFRENLLKMVIEDAACDHLLENIALVDSEGL